MLEIFSLDYNANNNFLDSLGANNSWEGSCYDKLWVQMTAAVRRCCIECNIMDIDPLCEVCRRVVTNTNHRNTLFRDIYVA